MAIVNPNIPLSLYILKRIGQAIISFWLVVTITFFAMHAIPGGPFQAERAASKATEAALEAKYGLDKSLLEQYFTYLEDVFVHADFGPSLKQRGRDVSGILSDGMWASVKIGVISLIFAEIIGVWLGVISAARHGTWVDRLIMAISTVFISVPSFVVGIFLLLIFSVKLHLLPSNGSTAAGLILPIVALGLYPMTQTTRLTRTSVMDELEKNYVRTVRANGLSERQVLFKHILKNAAIPIITFTASMLAYVVTGSVAIEQVFAVKGMGRILTSSITNRDYPLIMGVTIVLSAVVLLMNLICDVVYHLVDPRIRLH